MRLTVHYPIPAGQRLVLRTEHDWERDISPLEPGSTHATFDVAPSPTLALKPCLRAPDGQLHWAQGPDYVVTAHEPERGLWPYFFSPPQGRVSDLLKIGFEGVVRKIRVYHPPGYDENPLRRFPVMYMHDGQNLFFPQEAFGGDEWQVDETMDRLDQMNTLKKCVVVGISSPDRFHDYTRAGAAAYGRFMVNKLKPLVDTHVRTQPGPADTVVMGSSLGGVAALQLAWQAPHIFGKAGCLSATFGHFDDLFSIIASTPKPNLVLYLDSGWPKDNHDVTNAMRDLLMAKGFRLGVDLLHVAAPFGTHHEHSWAQRIYLPFQFFFGRAWLAQRSALP
jgi:predicted alpha/beta superfamily hydrolase